MKYIFVPVFVALVSCNLPKDIEKRKVVSGGIYEASAHGVPYSYSEDFQFLPKDTVKLDTMSRISWNHLKRLTYIKDRKQYILTLILNDSGKEKFNVMSTRNIDKRIYIVMNDKIINEAIVYTPLPGGEIPFRLHSKGELETIMEYFGSWTEKP